MKQKLLLITSLFAGLCSAMAQAPSDTNYTVRYSFSNSFDDGSGHANNATGTNVTFTTDRWGIGNSAVAFPATSAVVESKPYEIGGAFSVAAWIKCQNPKGFFTRIFDFGDGPAMDNILLAMYNSSEKLTGEAYSGTINGGADKVLVSDETITANQWTHVAYVNDGAGIGELYINGRLVKAGKQHIISKKTRKYHYFGKSLFSQDAPFTGKMDDIYVANRLFTPDEIDSLYKIVPTDLTIQIEDVTLPLGETFFLSPKVSKAYTIVEFSTFKSLDPSVATVTAGGLIKSVKIGTTKIVISTANGALTDTAEVRVVDPNATALYRFNNSYSDESGNGNDATGTDVSFTTDRFGVANSAVQFPATSAVVQGKSFETGGALSVAAWVKWKNIHSFYARVFDFGNGAAQDNILFGVYGSTAKLTGETYKAKLGGGIENTIITQDTLIPDVWTHLAYVNDGAGKGYIYVNGKLVAQNGQYAIDTLTRTYHYFGKSLFGQDGAFEGKMDDIYVGNKVFSAQLIDSLYKITPKDLSFTVSDMQVGIKQASKLNVTMNNGYDVSDFIAYQSLNPEIATVNEAGLVTGIKPGFVQIVVSTANGTFKDTALVRVPDPDMYAYYPFDNGSGRDESANGNDLQIINATKAKGRFGAELGALAFGATDKVAKTAATNINDNQITFSAWVLVKSFPTDQGHISSIVGSYSPSWAGLRLGDFEHAAANRAQLVLSNKNTSVQIRVNGTSDLQTNLYYFIVGTYDGATAKLYVNGKLEASEAFDENVEVTAPMEIGASNGERSLDGTIDEVRIYKRAISENEIDSLFKIMPQPAITKFDFLPNKFELQKDSTQMILGDIEPNTVLNSFVKYESSDPSVATVENSKDVKAHAVGTAKIFISTVNNLFDDTLEVTVIDTIKPITKLTLNKEKLTLIDTASFQLNTSIEPANASIKRVTYTSSNENVATVIDGKIVAKGAGSCLIIVQSVAHPTMKDTCTLTVKGRLVAYYPFKGDAKNEARGAVGYNGVVDKAQLTAGIDGSLVSAYHFNGKDQAINVVGALPRNNFTYSVWVKPDSAARKRNQFVISAWNGDQSDVIRISVNDSSFYAGVEDNGYQSIRSNRFVKNSKWYNVSLVKQADSISLFINGLKMDARHGLPISLTKTNTKFCIGSNPEYGFNEFFAGTIDELRIYSDALSDKQIDSLFFTSVDSIAMPKKLTIYKEQATKLPIYTSPDLDWSQNVRFESANTQKLTVDKSATLMGLYSETTETTDLYGWFNNLKDTCQVSIKDFIAVTSVAVGQDTVKLISGKSEQLTTSVLPVAASDKSLMYVSSNNAIASVDANGKLTAKAAGTCFVFVQSVTNPNVKDSVVVEVSVGISVTAVVLSKQTFTLMASKTIQLGATVTPAQATNKLLLYSSSDNTIAEVNPQGLVTAKTEGTVRIVVQSVSNPDVTDTLELTVTAYVKPSVDVELLEKEVFTLAPNPASMHVSVISSEAVLSIHVVPSFGVFVPIISVQNTASFEVSNLLPGLYLVYITTESVTRVEKLIIQR